MNHDTEKIDEFVLALLHLTSFPEGNFNRSWKGHDWDALDRLFEKGFIGNPKGKSKSIVFTEEGFKESKKLFEKHFLLKSQNN